MQKIRVVLVDDHHLVRKGFQALLSQEPDIEVVGEAADGREAVQLVEQTQPDVLVTDLAMPGLSGQEAIRREYSWSVQAERLLRFIQTCRKVRGLV